MVEEIARGQSLVETKIPRAGEPNVGVGAVLEGVDAAKGSNLTVDQLRAENEELNARYEALKRRLEMPFDQRVAEREKRIRKRPGIGEMFKKVGEAIKRFEEKSKNAIIHAEAVVEVAGEVGLEKAKQGMDKVRDREWREEQYKKWDKALKDAKERAEKARKASNEKFWNGVNGIIDGTEMWLEDQANKIVTKVEETTIKVAEEVGSAIFKPILAEIVIPAVNYVDEMDGDIAGIRSGLKDAVGGAIYEAGYKIFDLGSDKIDPAMKLLNAAREEAKRLNFCESGLEKVYSVLDKLIFKGKMKATRLIATGLDIRSDAQKIRQEYSQRHVNSERAMEDLDSVAVKIRNTQTI